MSLVDWRGLAEAQGTIREIEGGRSEFGGTQVGLRAIETLLGEAVLIDAANHYLTHAVGTGTELAKSVIQCLRPHSVANHCLQLFREADSGEEAGDAIELLRHVARAPMLEHFAEIMESPHDGARAWGIAMLDSLWMAGELEIEDGWPYLEAGFNDISEIVRRRASGLKEMWEQELLLEAERLKEMEG